MVLVWMNSDCIFKNQYHSINIYLVTSKPDYIEAPLDSESLLPVYEQFDQKAGKYEIVLLLGFTEKIQDEIEFSNFVQSGKVVIAL